MVNVVVKVIQVWVAEKVDTTEGERESEDEVWVVMVMVDPGVVAQGVVEAVEAEAVEAEVSVGEVRMVALVVVL
jgi:hypothetical protein